MIVHHGRRWLYLGIPKTATTALHDYLPTLGGEWLGDRQHDMQVPEACRDYLVFATSLNPYRRAWSLWRMFRGDAAKGAKFTRDFDARVVERFPDFVEALLLGPERSIRLYHWPMSRWLDAVPAGVDVQVVPAERLDAGLRRLGVIGPRDHVPVRNVTKGDWLAAYDDPTLAAAVRRWAAEDFRRLGYAESLAAWRRRARLADLRERVRHAPGRVLQRMRRLRAPEEPDPRP